MTPLEMRVLLDRKPFLPIRVHMSDGAHHDVRNPEMAMVGLSTLIVGIARDVTSRFFDEPIFITLRQITWVEPIVEVDAPSPA